MPRGKTEIVNMEVGNCQTGVRLAGCVWVVCVQVVDGLWRSLVQLVWSMHTSFTEPLLVWENSRFIHWLYKFYTQLFPTQNTLILPLLVTGFYTSSTGPIKRTKVQRKDYL